MSSGVMAEIKAGNDRVTKAQSMLANAKRRLSRAEESVRSAKADVAAAEIELKDSSTAAETLVLRNIKQALRRGGTSATLAMAELLARSLDEGAETDPAPSGVDGDPASGSATPPATNASATNPSEAETPLPFGDAAAQAA